MQQSQDLLKGLEDIELITMDAPGHGSSPLPDDVLPTFNYYGDQIMLLMEHLKVKKAILGGISMGAGIALNIALRAPEMVKALILIRPAWLDQEKPKNLEILLKAAKYIGQIGGAEIFSRSREVRQLRSVLPVAAQSVMGVFDKTQSPKLPVVLENMVLDKPFDKVSALAKIKVPSLLIGNENDPLHPLNLTQVIHDHIPKNQMFVVPSRYLNNTEHQKSVTQHISKFINDL